MGLQAKADPVGLTLASLNSAYEQREKFRSENRRLLEMLAAFDETVEIAESQAKSLLKPQYEGKQGGFVAFDGSHVSVLVTAKKKKTINIDELAKNLRPDLVERLRTYDQKKVDDLVTEGLVDEKLVKKFTTYEPMTPAFSFQRKA